MSVLNGSGFNAIRVPAHAHIERVLTTEIYQRTYDVSFGS